jgi:prepilin-type N-terminal cleavage/methylation domain-containing protein
MSRPSSKGFTLIELLTVIAIIGLLAAVLIPAAMGVQRRAKAATSQTVMSGWCSGILRFKQAYGFYPGLGAAAYPTADTCLKLESGTNASFFIMTLAGKNPNGSVLTTGPTGNRAKYNRNSEAFIDFSSQDYEDFTKLPISTDTTGTLGTNNFLVDRFGNRNIRVVIDYDNNGTLKSAAGAATATGIPAEILGYSTATGYPARVLIYTSRTEVKTVDVTGVVGTPLSDFLDVIAAQ